MIDLSDATQLGPLLGIAAAAATFSIGALPRFRRGRELERVYGWSMWALLIGTTWGWIIFGLASCWIRH